MTIILDSDRALEDESNDHFGFTQIAKRLAPSVLEASRGDGMVIGLEGSWGSGKTSLLNFLRKELSAAEEAGVHTITIAPWLNGDSSTLVMSLLEPIASILDLQEDKEAKGRGFWSRRTKKKSATIGEMIRSYGASTARKLVPVANLAGYFLPGGQVTSTVLETTANALDQFSSRPPTHSELKEEIADRLKKASVSFIVVLDDLDRLEPAQAVEVVRLVRSVADFPKVAYLMCYDRRVLSQALKSGLGVKDGDLFLQKIVQLSFAIPLPEPFDLRAQFQSEAEKIFADVTGNSPSGDLLEDLKLAIDREGGSLSTPREVKLALNGLKFTYPTVATDVYFPDFCRLQLIKVSNFRLYRWLEEYLAVRSIIVTGDGVVSKDSRAEMGKRLKKLAPSQEADSSRSIWQLRNFIPGIAYDNEPHKCVFTATSRQELQNLVEQKRLGSPFHYRFYFALTGPKTVLPTAEFENILRLAREDGELLNQALIEYASRKRQAGKSWFEHILERIRDTGIESLDVAAVSGLILSLSDVMDEVLSVSDSRRRRAFSISVEQLANRVVCDLLKQLAKLDSTIYRKISERVAREGKAINWLVGTLFRGEVWDHGRAGERKRPEDEWVFTDELLDELVGILRDRVQTVSFKESVPQMPDLASFLFGWRDVLGLEEPKKWVDEFTQTDVGFLDVLNRLRSWAMGDRVYFPLHHSSVSAFFDYDAVVERLNTLESGTNIERVQELKVALSQGRD